MSFPTSPMKLKDKRIFVTGATGFIGGYLARRLHAEGAHVLALEHLPGKGSRLAADGIDVITGDIVDSKLMDEIVSGGVQMVVHVAAWLRGRPYRNYQSVNVDATRHLAATSAASGVERFVFTSSIAVYGLHGDQDVDENSPLRCYGDPYGDSKIRGEQILQEIGREMRLQYCIVRPGMVYGPGSPGWSIRLASWAKRGLIPLVDGGRGAAYPVFIDNLIDLFVLCLTHPDAANQIINGVDDGPVSMAEFLGAYMQMVPTDRAIRLPGWVVALAAGVASPFSPGLNLNYVASQLLGRGQVSNRKAREQLGWQPRVPLAEGLQRTEGWLRNEGYL